MTKAARRKPRRDAGRPRGEPVAEVVLARTLEELATHGLAGVSVDRIARAAQVNKTSVYRRWPTREALVGAALQRVRADLSAKLKDTGSLRGDLVHLGKSVAKFLAQPTGLALARAALAEPVTPELAAQARRRLRDHIKGPVAELVARAKERGEWRPDAPPAIVLTVVVSAVLHRCLLERQPASGRWLDALVDVVLVGVTPDAVQ